MYYSTKIMAATDDTFNLMIGRARARKAFLAATEKMGDKNFSNFDVAFRDMKYFNKEIFDKRYGYRCYGEYSRQEASYSSINRIW